MHTILVHHVTFLQGEVEHKISKKRYSRSSRKRGVFEGQIADIERQQVRLARLRQRLQRQHRLANRLKLVVDPIALNFETAYGVGKSQNQPVNIIALFHKYPEDPAFVVRLFELSLSWYLPDPNNRGFFRN
jgi:hypothetical protein